MMASDWQPMQTGPAFQQLSWLPLKIYQATYSLQVLASESTATGTDCSDSTQQPASAAHPSASTLPDLLMQHWHQQLAKHTNTHSPDIHQSSTSTSSPPSMGSTANSATTISSRADTSSTGSSAADNAVENASASLPSGTDLVLTHWQSDQCGPISAMWSDHYKQYPREPDNTRLAPWVAPRYAKLMKARGIDPDAY